MTREQAIAARYRIAGMASLDGRAIASCNGSKGGCEYVDYDATQALSEAERAKLHHYDSHAGMWRVCPKHQPSKRHTWAWDVPIEAIMAQGDNGAWAIDALRSSLPRTHPDYRPAVQP